MNEMDFETRIGSIAKRMDYPRTPDIAERVMTRLHLATKPRFISKAAAWSLITILILTSSLFLIPPARAAIVEFIQIGIVRIFKPEATPIFEEIPSTMIPQTATPASTKESLIPILTRILGETTLEDAIQRVNFSILLPTYPSDLGRPDYVFVQDADGEMLILVWLAPEYPELIEMSLHFIPNDSWAIRKFEPHVIQETLVNGTRAFWTEGPYPLIMTNGNMELIRLIEGNVLIWTDGNITYRLESVRSLDEAVKIAESLKAIP